MVPNPDMLQAWVKDGVVRELKSTVIAAINDLPSAALESMWDNLIYEVISRLDC
jgi:hypothetical protein